MAETTPRWLLVAGGCTFCVAVCGAITHGTSAFGEEGQTWPLWDGHETLAQYARKANLEPTKTVDLGKGMKMELALIPAGKFVMGTPEPEPVDEVGFRQKIIVDQVVFGIGAGALLILLGVMAVRAIRKKQGPQYLLARFVVMTVVAAIALLGGMHWHFSAKAEHQPASARFGNSYESEKPTHAVTISKPFYLGRFEVTQEQYQQVIGSNPSEFKGSGLPVECVSWDEAQEFCKKVSEKTGQSVRLPSEAEWEYACRAGTTTRFCSGDADGDLESVAWYGANSGGTTHPVGQKTPNAWGVHDMHGNVWEQCADRYADYGTGAVTDPQGPAQGARRVLRGGSWGGGPWGCRSAFRDGYAPDIRGSNTGFRVAADVPPKAP